MIMKIWNSKKWSRSLAVVALLSLFPAANAPAQATNGSEGVRLIRANGITNYFGSATTAFTNALLSAQAGDTVRLGIGTYRGDGTAFPVLGALTNGVNIIGSGQGVWDTPTHQFYGGTIITNFMPFGLGYSNATLENLSIETAGYYALDSILFWNTNVINQVVRNVSLGHNNPAIGICEPVYFSGANITINNFSVFDLPYDALIIKGASNVVVDGFYYSTKIASTGFPALIKSSVTQNGNTTLVRLSNITIDMGTNAGSPVTLFADIGSVINDVVISDGHFRTTSVVPQDSVFFQAYDTNSLIQNVLLTRISQYAPANNCFSIFDSYPQGGVTTNIFITDCSIVSTNSLDKICSMAWYWNTNSVTFANVRFNGISHWGVDNHDTFSISTTGITVRQTATNSVVISWPSPATGFILQQNPDLSTTNWSAAQTPDDNGTNKTVIVTPPTGKMFYRLYHP